MKTKKPNLRRLLLLSLCFVFLAAVPVCALELGSGVACLSTSEPMIKSGIAGEPLSFSPADFRQAVGLSRVGAITVTELPDGATGTLKLSGFRVKEGERIPEASLSSLTFTAATPLVSESSFRFRAEEGSGVEMTCRIRLLDEVNRAPSVGAVPETRLSIAAQSGIKTVGTLSAYDPEGDEVAYLLVTAPEHGSVILTDPAAGTFCYTPAAGYTGSDRFRYVARDEYGNYSGIATVSVTVKERAASVTFDDMVGSAREGDALVAAAAGIMQGRIAGDKLLFDPAGSVTKTEFVVMAMKAAGIAPRDGLSHTFFENDADFPDEVRGYLATAQKMGIVVGTFGDDGLTFDGDAPITAAEAATVVYRALSPDGTAVLVGATPTGVPPCARVAVAALDARGMLDGIGRTALHDNASLSRADAASLVAALVRAKDGN
ncbi:MAG: cadherin-like domain-containing protein [Clostridia bacterium]|nr:cadherin-like domain-containing protein [Clostridia bacterium]